MTRNRILYRKHCWAFAASRTAVTWCRKLAARCCVLVVRSHGIAEGCVVKMLSGCIVLTRHLLAKFWLKLSWCQRWTWIIEVRCLLLPGCTRGYLLACWTVLLRVAAKSLCRDCAVCYRLLLCPFYHGLAIHYQHLVALPSHWRTVLVASHWVWPFQFFSSWASRVHRVQCTWPLLGGLSRSKSWVIVVGTLLACL